MLFCKEMINVGVLDFEHVEGYCCISSVMIISLCPQAFEIIYFIRIVLGRNINHRKFLRKFFKGCIRIFNSVEFGDDISIIDLFMVRNLNEKYLLFLNKMVFQKLELAEALQSVTEILCLSSSQDLYNFRYTFCIRVVLGLRAIADDLFICLAKRSHRMRLSILRILELKFLWFNSFFVESQLFKV